MKKLLYKILPRPFKNIMQYKIFWEYIGITKEERYKLLKKRKLNKTIWLLLLYYSYFIASLQLFFNVKPHK